MVRDMVTRNVSKVLVQDMEQHPLNSSVHEISTHNQAWMQDQVRLYQLGYMWCRHGPILLFLATLPYNNVDMHYFVLGWSPMTVWRYYINPDNTVQYCRKT